MARESVAENGDRIIRGSMRADGTFRKDVRVRAGYVPQDEQKTYVSREALERRGYQRCPGLDDSETKAAPAKSKAAKKNERRKSKKSESGADVTLAEPASESIANQVSEVRLEDSGANASSGQSNTFKKLRTLTKKLQQAEVLETRQKAGEVLTEPEKEKLHKVATWKVEVQQLEQQLQEEEAE